MTDLPPGFVMERPSENRPEPPSGFVIEGDSPPQQGGWFRHLDNLIRSVASGATFGLADEIAAGMGSLTGGGSYENLLEAERARDRGISAWTKVPGEIAGGAATAIAAGPIVAGTRIAQAGSRLPGWAQAAGLGGAFGGAYGFGTAEGGAEDRLKGAATGGAVGAAAGPAFYYAGRGLEQAGRAAIRGIQQRVGPQAAARRAIGQAFSGDEMTVGRARARLRELGPQATLADVGGSNVKGLARAAGGQPGPAKNRIEAILKARGEGEAMRIERAIRRGLDPEDFYAAEDAFLRNMREKAGPLYRQAYEKHQSIMSPRLNRLLTSQTGQRALRETAAIVADERAAGAAKYLGAVDDELIAAMRSARDVGKTVDIEPRPGVIRGFALETWDQIKRGFDSLLDRPAYRNELTGRLNARGRAVDQMRRTLIKELDKATGGDKSLYAKARAAYGGEAEAMTALREGRKAVNADPEQITRALRDLSAAGRDAYRSGFARALKDVVDKTPDTANIARRIWGNARSRERLRAIFPDRQKYNDFSRSMASEIIFGETKNAILAGSRTAPMLAEIQGARKAAGNIGAILGSDLPLGGHALVRAGIGRRIAEGLIGPENPEYYRSLSRMLVSRNQAENQFVLDHLRRLPPQDAAGRLSRVLSAIGGISGAKVEQSLNR